MMSRLIAAAAATLVLSGCQLIDAATETQDLYTVTPKSTFDPNLPAVYWQLAVEAPAAGRVALAGPEGDITYGELDARTDRLGAALLPFLVSYALWLAK